MWKVVDSYDGKFLIEKRIMKSMSVMHTEDGKVYKTPYHIEAQQIADELNKEKKDA